MMFITVGPISMISSTGKTKSTMGSIILTGAFMPFSCAICLRLARSWAVEEAAGDKPARLATAWGRINLWHEFLDSTATTEVSSATGFIPFSAALEQDWFEAFEFAYDMSVPTAPSILTTSVAPPRWNC